MSERLSPARIAQRQAKQEWRASVSREHGKTRAAAVAAFNNTIALRKRLWWTWGAMAAGWAGAAYMLLGR